MNIFPTLVRQRMPFRQAHYLLESAHSRDPGRLLSVTAVLNNSSVFAAVCSKRTGKDRHLLLTTNAGGGGEIQSLSCGGVWGGSIVLIGGGGENREGTWLPLWSQRGHRLPAAGWNGQLWLRLAGGYPPLTSYRPTSTQDCTSFSDFSSSCTFRAGQW